MTTRLTAQILENLSKNPACEKAMEAKCNEYRRSIEACDLAISRDGTWGQFYHDCAIKDKARIEKTLAATMLALELFRH